MSFKSILRNLAPVAIVALAAAASGGCDMAKVSINGEDGKPLADLDLTGTAPDEVALFGPDSVKIVTGDKLAITVDGSPEATDAMRFTLKDGTLGILRKRNWSGDDKATVNITMPAPRQLMMAGSGRIDAAELAADSARVSIAGSGSIVTGRVETGELKVDIAGSGNYSASGSAKSLKLSMAGSGGAKLDGLKVETAKVDIAGSGSSAFASDGTVKANIMGSGKVRVIGRATCKVNSMGSGTLVCESGSAAAGPGAKPEEG